MKQPYFLLIVFIILLSWGTLSAQSIWVDQIQGSSIAIEILKPNFEGDDNLTFLTSVWFLTGRFALGNVTFVAEFPFAHAGFDNNFGFSEDQTIVGNPYVGIETQKQNSPVYGELGLRFPLTPDDKDLAMEVGFYSDWDRLEAYLPDFVTLTGKLNYHKKNSSNIVFRLHGGPTFLINTASDGGDDTELLLDYSGQVGYEGNKFSIVTGLTGRLLASEEGLDLGERTFHHLGISGAVKFGQVRPGFYVRLPVDDNLQDILDIVIGLNLAIQLNK